MNLKDFGVDIQGYHCVHIGKQIPKGTLYPGPALTCPGVGFRNPCIQYIYTYMYINVHKMSPFSNNNLTSTVSNYCLTHYCGVEMTSTPKTAVELL